MGLILHIFVMNQDHCYDFFCILNIFIYMKNRKIFLRVDFVIYRIINESTQTKNKLKKNKSLILLLYFLDKFK